MNYNVKALFENIRFHADRVINERDRPYGYSMMQALVDIEKDWKKIEQLMLNSK